MIVSRKNVFSFAHNLSLTTPLRKLVVSAAKVLAFFKTACSIAALPYRPKGNLGQPDVIARHIALRSRADYVQLDTSAGFLSPAFSTVNQ